MFFKELWTLVLKSNRTLVPPVDDDAQGMLFTSQELADDEAKQQTKAGWLGCSPDNPIIAVKIEIGDKTENE